MCRSIKVLRQPDGGPTDQELYEAALQYVRKISGFRKPSRVNQEAFDAAVAEIARISAQLLAALEITASPKNREEVAAKAVARAAQRYSR